LLLLLLCLLNHIIAAMICNCIIIGSGS